MYTKIYIIIETIIMLLNCVISMNFTKYICHRIPERSFFIKGHQFPVCARCTGLYISGIATIILINLFPIPYSLTTLLLGIILLIPCAIDGFTQLFEMRESNNTLRFITGILGGIGLIFVYEIMIEFFAFNFL